MTAERRPRVVRAEVILAPGSDPQAVGGAVTTELCGSWTHDSPCRWPHNNDIDTTRSPAAFRTVFVAPDAEAGEVQQRIVAALQSGGWTVLSVGLDTLTEDERALGDRLVRG